MSSPYRIQSILVATDLTANSDAAVRSAADLALAASAELHVIHAHEESWAISSESRDLLKVQQEVHDKRRNLLKSLQDSLPAGVKLASSRAEIGVAADVIVEAATSAKAGIVVLGAHRNRGIADRYLGSTAERILGELRVPCLLVNAPLHLPIRNILIPSDFSEPSRQAVRAAFEFAGTVSSEGVTLTLAHVLDTPDLSAAESWKENDLIHELRLIARRASTDAGVDLPFDVEILPGSDPAESLMRRAEDSGADMIVMGTHGDGILVRALLSSVTSTLVRRSSTPIMLVPRVADPIAEAEGDQDGEVVPIAPIISG